MYCLKILHGMAMIKNTWHITRRPDPSFLSNILEIYNMYTYIYINHNTNIDLNKSLIRVSLTSQELFWRVNISFAPQREQ